MEKKNTTLIITIVILVMLILFGGLLFTLSSMGYLNFDKDIKEDNNITENEDNEEDNTKTILDEIETLRIAKELTKKYFEYYHALGPYCGGFNNDDYISFGSYETFDFRDYYSSSKFKNISELKKYFSSFMIESLYPNYLNNGTSYLEQDGKLYCQLSHKGCGDIYNDNLSTYTIKSISDNLITANATIISDTCGEEQNRRICNIEITKDSNGNWLISKYEFELSNQA